MVDAKKVATAKASLQKNRNDALELVEFKGKRMTRKLLEKAQAELTQRITQAEGLSGPGKDSFTAVQLRATLTQVETVTKHLSKWMRGTVMDQGEEAADAAVDNTLEYLTDADAAFRGVGTQPLAIREGMMFERARQGVESSILRRLASDKKDPARVGILQRYGMSTLDVFEDILQQSMVTKRPWADIRADLVTASPFLQGKPVYWAERIVRTESMHAYNRAGWESLRAADEELGDMVKILAATFDDRTGSDSFAVHGQIRRPEEAFQWWDGLYQHPPNRPNDREVVVPHRKSWVIPPYLMWKTPEQIMQRWRLEKRRGAPPPRPLMTTIPLQQFGS